MYGGGRFREVTPLVKLKRWDPRGEPWGGCVWPALLCVTLHLVPCPASVSQTSG